MTALTIEDVQDYPRPPALREVPHNVRIEFGGRTIVETDQAFQVLETHHAPTYYIPPHDIDAVLTKTSIRSYCEWKGVASYWDVQSGAAKATKAAWSYEEPTTRFEQIKGYVAFFAGLMGGCFVGKHRVIPQPGDFYGGWVTENLKGRIKGSPGTELW
ncbi:MULTISPECIES: DUF427 domain-containing protein [unclassified Ruegeria]|uniref:DUF427 domain-containing protein n=1 Tax=unclassified Ruegeria TaxID=2625375 RepID=UPI0014897924|nr:MULTISPECIES: DUF427 domain-containing protein [unclassified Ruegeria]